MALDKAALTTALTSIFEDLTNKSASTKASEIADAIDTYVKTATVDVASVSGVTPGAGVSGPGTGTLS